MLRFDQFTIGYAWRSDYGSPSENEAEFRAILRYSPLHNVRPNTPYPPTLILTADHDDRVFPAHSFKFTAEMQHQLNIPSAALNPGAPPSPTVSPSAKVGSLNSQSNLNPGAPSSPTVSPSAKVGSSEFPTHPHSH